MICHYLTNILLLFDLDIKNTAKRKNTNFTLFPFHIYVHESKIKQREERRWLRQNLLAPAIFSF